MEERRSGLSRAEAAEELRGAISRAALAHDPHAPELRRAAGRYGAAERESGASPQELVIAVKVLASRVTDDVDAALRRALRDQVLSGALDEYYRAEERRREAR
ncbi:MAG TPA: hypothetical protein VJ803_07420 [Gemmatimonadaceae bacterium]|jgi:hypothetical protein|nr:hypothetical protein [Gemmatimonadaceae bacterium]